MPSSRSASRLSVTFDDDHSVADAGLALVAVLSEKLDLEELARIIPLYWLTYLSPLIRSQP